MDPLVRGGEKPMMAAQSVVFPMPLRPTIATGSSPSSNVTSWRIRAEP